MVAAVGLLLCQMIWLEFFSSTPSMVTVAVRLYVPVLIVVPPGAPLIFTLIFFGFATTVMVTESFIAVSVPSLRQYVAVMDTVPALTAVTLPFESTVATDVLSLLHVTLPAPPFLRLEDS